MQTQGSNPGEIFSLDTELATWGLQSVGQWHTVIQSSHHNLRSSLFATLTCSKLPLKLSHMARNMRKTAVASLLSQTYKDFQVKYCGMILDKEHPWLHATPDFMASCSRCGDGYRRFNVLMVSRMGI